MKMENGQSPVLGSSQSESDGSELMEGAAAAVGRQQSFYIPLFLLSPILLSHLAAQFCLRLSGVSAGE